MNDIYNYIVPGFITLLMYLLIQIGEFDRWLNGKLFFKGILFCIFIFQVLTIFLIQFQVGDVMLFSDAGYYFRNGVDYYWIDSDHTQYPFFPFLIFFHAVANKLTYIFPAVNFVQVLKIGLLIPLYLIARFIYKNSKLELIEKRRRVYSFLLNPVTYSVVLFHGQIDVILIAFLIYAVQAMVTAKSYLKVIVSGLLFAASVATKTWSVIFLPLYLKFFGFRKTFVVGITTLLFLFVDVFIYTRMVFGSAFRVVLPAILKPGGPVGIWGISLMLKPWSEYLSAHNLFIFGGLLSIGLLVVFFNRFKFWVSACLLVLWVYLIIPNWGIQYLFWVIPFSYLIKRDRKWVGFELLAGVYVFFNYLNVISPNMIPSSLTLGTGLLVWLYVMMLLLSTFREMRETG